MSDPVPAQSQAVMDLIESLSEKQRMAFESLRTGGSFVVAAEQAGVARMTVYRWIKSDPDFRTAYNAWRQELAESAQTRLLKLADRAVDCVEIGLNSNDFGVAVSVLSKMGIMRKTGRGSIDREVVRMQQDLEQQREKYKAAIGLMRHLLDKAGLKPGEQMEYIRQHGVDPIGLPGYEPIPQPEDELEELDEESDLPGEDLSDEAQAEQGEENPSDPPAPANAPDVDANPSGQMAEGMTEPMLQMPVEASRNAADPLSRAG